MSYRFFLAVSIALQLSAGTVATTWTGQTDGSWTNAANWSNGIASNSPANNFNATFPDVSPAAS
jgi:hypothetical protein